MEKMDLPNKMNKMLEYFAKSLASLYKDELVSVILYGSAASGEYSKTNSNINIAVVLKDAQLENIAKSSILMRKFYRVTPVFFTEKFIRDSADVFPIEFLDIKENHIVLYGRDILNDLKIDGKNLRFQCEQELKSKLINLKKAYIQARTASGMRRLLFRFFISTLHIMRNIIRLKGRSPSYRKEDILAELSKELNIDVKNMRAILDAKTGKTTLKDKEIESLFIGFAEDLEKVSEIVDKI